jgi:hypothetical protein
LVKIAEGAPRFLVSRNGWEVIRADEFSGKIGEMTFSDGTHELELRWIPKAWHESVVEDRRHGAGHEWAMTIAGEQAVLIQYEGSTVFTAMWPYGDHSMELVGDDFADVDAYRSVASTLQAVDVDTWLSAMPESVIKPASRASSVDEMLADMPIHPDVDVAGLKSSESVSDRYQLGAKVSGAVACAWLGQWVDATAAGDEGAAQEAVDAMATSHDWAILNEMNEAGDYPETVWEYADAMPNDDMVSGGRPMTIKEAYRQSLGCDD